ncbi:MAG TPA: class I SAM-dependent methyltransferase [Candidatus Solibacter sp.]|nr:class I SAM-dependent methyltransferase [Candidatus Solibacter sp.]
MTRPVPRRIEEYYRERYYGGRHSFTRRFCTWRRRRLLRKYAGRGGRLLDVGSGEGDFVHAATQDGWEAAGVEIHRTASASQHRVFPSLEEAGMLAPFRCITLWHVLEHVPDPRAQLIQLRAALERDGVIIVAVPDFGGAQARIFGSNWLHLDVPRHLHHFTQSGLTHLFELTGFDVVRVSNQELEYDLFGWIQSALNALTRMPNVLFDALTGKPPRVGRASVAASYAAACALAMPSLLMTFAASLLRRGGTIIVVARPRQ